MAWFSWADIAHNKNTDKYQNQLVVLKHIYKNYGGELVLSPGDIASYGGISYEFMKEKLNLGNITNQKAVYKSHLNCFQSSKELFREAGYDNLLVTVGDHELGDNSGFRPNEPHSKVDTFLQAREAFGDGFNRNKDNEFTFDQHWFNETKSRPVETDYANTSFAYV